MAESTNCVTIMLTLVVTDPSKEGSRWVHTPKEHAEWIIARLLTKVAVVEDHEGQCAGCRLPFLMSYIVSCVQQRNVGTKIGMAGK